MCSKRVVRLWRQCSNWFANWASCCSACAEDMRCMGPPFMLCYSCNDECRARKAQMSRRPIGSTRMPVRAEIATAQPAVIGAVVIWTEMLRSVDGAPASSGEGEHKRGCARRFGWCIGAFLTRCAERFVEQPSEGFGFCGVLAPRLIRLQGCLGGGARIVEPLDMEEEADQDESDQEELVQQQVWRHDDIPS